MTHVDDRCRRTKETRRGRRGAVEVKGRNSGGVASGLASLHYSERALSESDTVHRLSANVLGFLNCLVLSSFGWRLLSFAFAEGARLG